MKIGFIVQRCGPEVIGGAESHCLRIAEKLGAHVETEIITTCALDYNTWKNYYPPGIDTTNQNVRIHRFPVTLQRNMRIFDLYSRYLSVRRRVGALSTAEQELWMKLQGPYSRGLFSYLRENHARYDHLVFFTYLYATTYFGLIALPDRAWLVPTAHDEWPIYLPFFEKLFSAPKGFFFNTRPERDFLRQRFPKIDLSGPIVGVGVDTPAVEPDPAGFREETGIREPFLLYVGRIDTNKGCPELFDLFARLRNSENGPRKLVLCGKAYIDIPAHPDILHLGIVDEQTKQNALAACDWLVNPSLYESLSLVLLEAWQLGRPTLVNKHCRVTLDQTRRSNGGLSYSDYESFADIVRNTDTAAKAAMGEQGKQFVEATCSWDAVIKKYLQCFTTGTRDCE